MTMNFFPDTSSPCCTPQDPEMMAEAKKMMDSPEFQKQMKGMGNNKDVKDSFKKTADIMKDPAKAAEAEAKFEHMLKVGNNELKQAAGGVMEDAMAAMANPEVMAEMAKMVNDPGFQQQLADMATDPSFKSYIDAVSITKSITTELKEFLAFFVRKPPYIFSPL
jgi:tripartite-type tricarboxylate transporter receptor subunit TctC